ASLPGFVAASAAQQDAMLRAPEVNDFVARVLADTLDVMYGPPEYGGNRGLVGWTTTGWAGDVQPRGYKPREVRELDATPPTPLDAAGARDALTSFIPGIRLVDPADGT